MNLLASVLVLVLSEPQSDESQTSKDPEIRKIDLSYDKTPLSAVLDDLQKKTGIPIEMDEAARRKVDPDKALITTTIRDLSLYKALYLLVGHLKLTVQVVDRKKVLIIPRD